MLKQTTSGMKYYSQYISHDLFELQESLSGLSKSNRWVKLADSLPWDKIEKEYNRRLKNIHNGAGNKPARMVVGALIVKHMENLSDAKTIQSIQENPYMQYLLVHSMLSAVISPRRCSCRTHFWRLRRRRLASGTTMMLSGHIKNLYPHIRALRRDAADTYRWL